MVINIHKQPMAMNIYVNLKLQLVVSRSKYRVRIEI